MIGSEFDLTGRVAVVTGGAGLLGRQHCRALLDCGAKVYLADIRMELVRAACNELGENCLPLELDVTQSECVESALGTVLSEQGRVDILVNNAAIDPKVNDKCLVETSRVENFPIEQWDFQLDVGLKGAFLCSKFFGSWMAKNGGGCILNIASDLSVFAPDQRIYRRVGVPEESQPVKPVDRKSVV